MPSPFPGMDPYLEGSLWQSVHFQFISEIARQLAPKIRPRYLALTPERFVYELPEDVAIAVTIPVGWPAGPVGPVSRRPYQEVLHRDRYGHGAAD